MKTAYNFDFSDGFVQVFHTDDFVVTAQSIKQFWNELAEFCKKKDCKKVLAEGKIFKRKMSTVEAFESGNTAGKKILGLWLACVFPQYKPDETTEFFKTVAKNRGVRIEFFTDREKALEWLNVADRTN